VPVQYPLVLKEKGIGGTVRLKVFIKPDGSVRDTEVLGGATLAESAQKSVSQWKFSPGNSETTMIQPPNRKTKIVVAVFASIRLSFSPQLAHPL
jgi:TonB family protein